MQFELKAAKMLASISAGRALHRSGNIKASGSPLEESLRALLEESLPSTSKVASGYFYGADSQCSPEVDVLIYEDKEAFRLDPAAQDQHYVPYTCVSIIGQVKNSADDLPGAIKQIQKCKVAWLEMRAKLHSAGVSSGQPHQEDPLSFIVCGECADTQFERLSSTLAAAGSPFADYILLLDRGLIIAGDLDYFEFDNPTIDFLQYRNVNRYQLCRPDGPDDAKAGLGLLWLYFALVAKLNLDGGNNLRYQTFCRQIATLYPLRPIAELLSK
ncbi:DUF6602 domain-containing protein [Dyella psychrodurans]|uniref:DUF6602 domain-containing protein n=1 Tax=Dyella psychrodurans TaxID=1927960 RepID=A0A370WY38_9GAMM|nr:DUF6602 domain-containing protein [Dyella psychrodurans]RDS80976.1 hypothetical protein DWU99_18155 [Dyella psychrodurans]